MRPSDYRRKEYARSIKQNNFYNGEYLPMAFMNNIVPPDEYDIWQAQKSAIMTHTLSMNYQKLLRGLNTNIFYGAANDFNPAIEAAVTNHIADKIDEIRKQYYPTVKGLRSSENNQQQLQLLQTQSIQLFQEYTNLLNFINRHISSGSLGVPGAPIIKQLDSISMHIQQAVANVSKYLQSPSLGTDIADYFYSINTMFSAAMGFALEDEVTSAVTGWLPTNMVVESTGNIQVVKTIFDSNGAKNTSNIAGVDNMVFDKELMKKIKITWQQAKTGSSQQKQQYSGTLEQFFEQMKQMSREETFYMKETTYNRICKTAIATLQAKAMGVGAKTMIMKRDVQLFQPISWNYGKNSPIQGFMINNAFRKYMTNELYAVVWMKALYEVSNRENAPKPGNYVQRHQHYQALINYSLSKMVPYILGNNEFLLSNKYGLISFFDFFEKSHNRIFTWGPNKTASLESSRSNLATAKYNILLHQ